MSAEFIDTNILIYASHGDGSSKHNQYVELLARLFEDGTGAVSTQVLIEFYSAATRKMAMTSQEAEATLSDLRGWVTHRPDHASLLRAVALQRRAKISWWGPLIVQTHSQRFGALTVRNPFRAG